MRQVFAHSLAGRPKEEWHRLEDHLRGTAEKAARFASSWGANDAAYLAGLWHDLGKYSAAFQARIGALDDDEHVKDRRPGHVDHSTAGAIFAIKQLANAGLPIAMAIAGHHAGLGNLQESVKPRLGKKELLEAATEGCSGADWLGSAPRPALPERFQALPKGSKERSLEFWIRFLFSALVDADFLDTEAFYDGSVARERSIPITVQDLAARLEVHIRELTGRAPDSSVNACRRRILEACRQKAVMPPGAFSLTAPTGSGKTLAGMMFALEHAATHGLNRVIVVLPFTSIIEQSADVYREVFGGGPVVEHHSNLDPLSEDRRNRLASENWDAPIVVTTAVQFFESLFGNRTSVCRKLHNIARSVVILDEAQTLPAKLLDPILEGLRELTSHYGCSVLISTATQPAFRSRPGFRGVDAIREIVPDPQTEFRALRRVRVEWPEDLERPSSWGELAERVAGHAQVLAIVHKKADAHQLAELLGEGTIHLSAAMCAAHRLEVIREIRARLHDGEPVKVVSTQLVEAGVDIDFPVVYRALAGFEALAQSAGRCNREGRLPQGRFIVFVAPSDPPPGILRKGLSTARILVKELGERADPLDPEIFERYFRDLYLVTDTTGQEVQRERAHLSFENVARAFKIIEEGATTAIVVPYGDAEGRVARLQREGVSRQTLRALQPHLVQVYSQEFQKLRDAGAIEQVEHTVWTLTSPFKYLYSQRFGLLPAEGAVADPASLIT